MNRELNIRIVFFFRFAGKVAITVLLLMFPYFFLIDCVF